LAGSAAIGPVRGAAATSRRDALAGAGAGAGAADRAPATGRRWLSGGFVATTVVVNGVPPDLSTGAGMGASTAIAVSHAVAGCQVWA
jgi:hypothetical protein